MIPSVYQAVQIATRYGMDDGAHHKMWVIDQMLRALTDCPIVEKIGISQREDGTHIEFSYQTYGESEEYKRLIAEACAGDDGPQTYSWSVGIAP